MNTHMRPVTVLEVVKQVSNMLWPYLFGKQPDSLQRDDEVLRFPVPCQQAVQHMPSNIATRNQRLQLQWHVGEEISRDCVF